MTDFRKRDEHSFWSNPETITDRHEALSLLLADAGSRDPTHLRRALVGITFVWEIVVPWYHEGSSGHDTEGTNHYDVSDGVAERLTKEGLVKPYLVKGWGWSYDDPERLVITQAAAASLRTYEEELRTGAPAMLKPGIHTDLSTQPLRLRSGREQGNYGRFYVDFETPQGDTCRVYPEQHELICPYPPAQQAEAA